MKKLSLFTIFLKLSYFTIVLVLIAIILKWAGFPYTDKWIGIMIAFFFFLTLKGIALIVKHYLLNPDSFAKYFFIVMIGRLLLGIAFVTLGLYLNVENKFLFIINFLILYLFYLGFEIYYLITNFQSRTG